MGEFFQLENIQDTLMAPETLELIVGYSFRLISAFLILIAGWIIGGEAKKRVQKISRLDGTLSSFLGGFVKYLILAVAIITVLGQFGVQTASLLAVLGAAGLAVGLALQGTLSNVAAGMMLLILRPFNVGDYVTYGSTGGTVKSLNLFVTELATPDNVYIFAPNSSIWNTTIFNYSKNDTRRQDFSVGISYDDSIEQAFEVLQAVLNKENRLIREEGKMPQVMVEAMADSSVNLKVRIWSRSADYWDLHWALNKAFKEALDEAGITIPFPCRTVEIVGGGSGDSGADAIKGAGGKKSTSKKAA